MAIIGFVLIFSFGFNAHELNLWIAHRFANPIALSHSEWWEFGALFWSLFFGIYYYFTFDFLQGNRLNRFLSWIISVGTIALCILAGYYLFADKAEVDKQLRDNPQATIQPHHHHFIFIIAIGMLFFLTDLVLWWKHQSPDPKKKFLESLWVADAPMLAALWILFVFQIRHNHPLFPGDLNGDRKGVYSAEMETFLAGAISFQLIVSNVIFLLSQFGVFRRIWVPSNNEPRKEPEQPRDPGAKLQ